MLDSNFAQQIADLNAQSADIEQQIVQNQKRVENLRAKGADATELKSTIAALTEALAHLEACKTQLEAQGHGGAGA